MSQFTSDTSLIDDPRLTISDTEVEFTVPTGNDTTEVYTIPTNDYATSLETQATTGNLMGTYH